MAQIFNLIRVATATTGTGTISLGAPVSGFKNFNGVLSGSRVSYGIRDGANSEYGIGTYAAAGPTLNRGPLVSTNGDAAINLSGDAEVFVTAGAEQFYTGSTRASAVQNFTNPVTGNVSALASNGYEHVFLMQANATIFFEANVNSFVPTTNEYLAVIIQDGTGGRVPTFQDAFGNPLTELNTFPTWASRPANGIDFVSIVQSTYGQSGPMTDRYIMGTHLFSGTAPNS